MGREPEGQPQPLQNRAPAEQAAEGARSWAAGAVRGRVCAAGGVTAPELAAGSRGRIKPSRPRAGGPRSTACNTSFLQPSSLK